MKFLTHNDVVTLSLLVIICVTGCLIANEYEPAPKPDYTERDLHREYSQAFPNKSQFCISDVVRTLTGRPTQYEWCERSVDFMLKHK